MFRRAFAWQASVGSALAVALAACPRSGAIPCHVTTNCPLGLVCGPGGTCTSATADAAADGAAAAFEVGPPDARQGTVLVSGETSPAGLDVSSSGTLVWADEVPTTGAIRFCAAGSCSKSVQTIASCQDDPGWVHVDRTGLNVIWTTALTSASTGGVYRAPLAASATILKLAAGYESPTRVVDDGTYAYFAVSGATMPGVYSVPLAGGTAQTIYGSAAYAVAALGTTLYWADAGAAGTVYGCNLCGGTCMNGAVLGGLDQVRGLFATTGTVFIAEHGSGTVADGSVRSAKMVLAPTRTGPWDITSDGANVYWTERGSHGSVDEVSATGSGVPVVLATGQSDPWGIALDATYVYWTDHGDGTVRRTCR